MIPKRLRLGIYPYAFARISVMRTRLIDKDEYHKLLKLEPHSLVRYLEDTDYKQDLIAVSGKDAAQVSIPPVDMIEDATWANTARTFEKLMRITTDEPHIILRAYARRWDFANLLTVLRARQANLPKEELTGLLMPIGSEEPAFYIGLYDLPPRELLMGSGLLEPGQVDAIAKLLMDNNHASMETALNRIYYDQLLELTRALPRKNPLTEFLLTEIDVYNIKTLLRLVKHQFSLEEIASHLLPEGLHLKGKLVTLAQARSLDQVKRALAGTPYQKLLTNMEDSLMESELNLERYHLARSFVANREDPLTVLFIMGYMLEKEMEGRNLRTIAKARQAGIEPEYIEEKLLVVER